MYLQIHEEKKLAVRETIFACISSGWNNCIGKGRKGGKEVAWQMCERDAES